MVAIALVVVGASIVGCDPVPTEGGASTEAAPAEEAAAPKPLDLEIGKPADYGDWVVTVKSAGDGPKDFAGEKTYKVSVVYENKSQEAVSYNIFDWSYEDEGGARHQDTAMIEGNDGLSSGELAPGGKVEGDIFFAPKGKMVKVVYMPSMLAEEENKATWVVK